MLLAVGSHSRIPSLPGLEQAGHWTNREGTSLRELPDGVVVLGGGPSGLELGQVYARYGVPVTIVHPRDRLNDRDHPRSSRLLADALNRDGVQIRLNARATGVRAGAGQDGRHVVELSDGSTVEGAALLMTIGRDIPLAELNLAAIGVEPEEGRVQVDDRLRIAPNVYVAGDVAGPELHTHTAHYQGEIAVRIALGEDVRPDHTAIPRAIYTDPETSSTGLLVEQARERGIDAFELSAGPRHQRQRLYQREPRPRHDRGRPQGEDAGRRVHGRSGGERDDPRGRAGGQAAHPARRCWPTRSTPSRPWHACLARSSSRPIRSSAEELG